MNYCIKQICRLLLTVLAVQNTLPAMADEVNIAMQALSSGGFYIKAKLNNGVETDMLLDTGSSYVVIGSSTFNKIAANTELMHTRDIYGAMANGKIEKVSVYILDSLQLSDNCILRNVEVVLLPNADKDILGLNALSLIQPFTLQMSPAILSSQNCAS